MNKSRQIAYTATFIALIFISLMLDTAIGSLMPIKPAIISLPTVFTFILATGGIVNAVVGGLSFGILSLARSFLTGSVPFQNPLVSVLPRMILGIATYGVYKLSSKVLRRKERKEEYSVAIASAIGVVINTATVLTMMYLTSHSTLEDVFGAIISINFPIEIVATTILTPILTIGVKRGIGKAKKRIVPTQEEE